MRKIVITAVALATVLSGSMPSLVSADSLQTSSNQTIASLLTQKDSTSSVATTIAVVGTTTGSSSTSTKSATQTADTSAPATSAASPTPVIVAVQSGDSLSSIASTYNTTWVRLYDANSFISDPNIINPGDQVRVPDATEQLTDRPLAQTQTVTASSVTQSSYVSTTTTNTVTSYPTDSNAAKAFIYSHESGNNPNATNPNGCYGLGQDCNGRVRALCGADYSCQDAYFTNYAMSRYGSWAAAEAFWLAHSWW